MDTTHGITIQEVALLVSLRTKRWTNERVDRTITKAVLKKHQAAPGSGKFSKKLLNPKAFGAQGPLAQINKLLDNVRAYHNLHTLPFGDRFQGILPSIKYFEYNSYMKVATYNLEGLVGRFQACYDDYLEEAKQQQNGLFNIEDYPKVEQLPLLFGIQVEYSSLSLSQAFQELQLPESARQELTQQAENYLLEKLKRAQEDLLVRLQKVLQPLTELDKKEKVCRSLLVNLEELVRVIPSYKELFPDLYDQLENTVEGIRTKILSFTPEDLLAENPQYECYRSVVAQEAKVQLDQVDNLLNCFGHP